MIVHYTDIHFRLLSFIFQTLQHWHLFLYSASHLKDKTNEYFRKRNEDSYDNWTITPRTKRLYLSTHGLIPRAAQHYYQHTSHSDHSFVFSLWLCSDKVCPYTTDLCLRVTRSTLISGKLSKGGWQNSSKKCLYSHSDWNQSAW